MVDLIVAKRDNRAHAKEEIQFIIDGVMNGNIPDYQLSAWLMAVVWRGMSLDETAWLTEAMCNSGQVLDLSSIGSLIADKHSTGGVGDKTTIVLTPLLVAAGMPVAKLSGRGLGHTGGTIDKFEAIPGFNTNLTVDQFKKQIKEIGAAIVGQTQDLVPADGKLYALRDVTGTVESLPLIASSVMCKKIAAGANLIVLDVKCGSAALMKTEADAIELAKTMVAIGQRLHRPVAALVTGMEQPLGFAIGHTLEIKESIDTLSGKGPSDLKELCLSLGTVALLKTGKFAEEEKARERLEKLLGNGSALECFRKLIVAQGGNPNVIEHPELMPTAKFKLDVPVPGSGEKWIRTLDGKKIANACKLMGAGRAKKGDPINLAVGVVIKGKVGDALTGGDCLATVYTDDKNNFESVKAAVYDAFTFDDKPVEPTKLIKAAIT
jgi:pyrimidine-nucleoside phosphorylase